MWLTASQGDIFGTKIEAVYRGYDCRRGDAFEWWISVPFSIQDVDDQIAGIIYGDIKPQNVLVFADETCSYTAKVTHFRFASENFISLPKSWPWNAPEYHHRGFTPSAAIKMDVFCLELLCRWLVSKKHLSGDTSTILNDFGGYTCLKKRNLEKHKFENKLVTNAHRHTTLLDLEENRKGNLMLFFSSALANDPNQWDGDFKAPCKPSKAQFVRDEQGSCAFTNFGKRNISQHG